MIGEHDLMFTDMLVPFDPLFHRWAGNTYKNYLERTSDIPAVRKGFQLITYLGCMASYIVNRKSITLICKILATKLQHAAQAPIDIFLKARIEAGELKAWCLFPFMTSIRLNRLGPGR